jgi:predicted DCC family thiol-disulfide oxidoreductase YuxK
MPVLVFDGRCGFCTRATDWLAPRLRSRTRIVPWQHMDPGAVGLTRDDVARTVWWIEPDGRRVAGAAAVARALLACGAPWRFIGRFLQAPGIRWIASLGYRGVARIRRWLPGTTPACERSAPGRVRPTSRESD